MTGAKLCQKCHTVHDAVSWRSLRYVGRMHVDADAEGPAEDLELRNCDCGSTLAVVVTEEGLAA